MADHDGGGPMPDRAAATTDAALEAALHDLAGALAVPVGTVDGGLDPARRARQRIERGTAIPRSGPWARLGRPRPRPLQRGFVLALVALVVLAAVAGAIGFGLPGIRIVPAPSGAATASATGAVGSAVPGSPSSSPPPTGRPATSPGNGGPSSSGPAVLGGDLGLGEEIAVADAPSAVDLPLALPTAPGVGSPATAWLLDRRLTLVWPSNIALPATREAGIGLILAQFRGSVDPGYFEKVVGPGTRVEAVSVGGVTGWWISGEPHEMVFVDEFGQPVFDSRRIVGDTLLWARGDVTYRLESGLDRAGAIALAESLR